MLYQSVDLAVPGKTAFGFLEQVEKWPVWLSFMRTVKRLEPQAPLGPASEVAIRSAVPGDEEELFEVDRFVDGFILSLVGVYSVRRRIEMRIEGKTARSKLSIRLDYPIYGGAVAQLVDRATVRRRLDKQLADSLLHFKGLIEYEGDPAETAVVIEHDLAVVDANC
jgi:uncharacterized membrane protein